MNWRPFLIGKLPAHGDFVTAGLTRDAQADWSQGLAAGMASARDSLGEDFEPVFREAPPWRFTGPSGDGGCWIAGAITGSQDASGRLFPLVLGLQSANPLNPDGAGGALAKALEAILYLGIGQNLTAEEVMRAAYAALGEDAPGDAIAPPRLWTLGQAPGQARRSGLAPRPSILMSTMLLTKEAQA